MPQILPPLKVVRHMGVQAPELKARGTALLLVNLMIVRTDDPAEDHPTVAEVGGQLLVALAMGSGETGSTFRGQQISV